MATLRQLKIRAQLIVLLAAVFTLFLVSAVVSNQALERAKTEFTGFITQDQRLLLNYTELYANGLQMGQALRNIILDPANPKAYENFDKASMAETQQITLVLNVLAVLAGLGIAFAIVVNILGQINTLGSSIEALAQGEGDLTVRLKVQGGNELCRVSTAFNQFVEGLQGMVNGIKTNANQLHALSSTLSQASSSLRATTADQTGALTSTASAVDEMTSSIAFVAEGAERVKDVSAESAEYSDRGLGMMGELDAAMSGAQQAVLAMAGSVGQFLESTQHIIGATQHVKDIAEQINLLALNAAIEAARAGEQGRGFAVVADEVRKLAEKTALYANEISRVTAELESRSSQVENTIRQGESALEESARRGTEVSAVVQQAHSAVLNARRGVEEITASVKEQSLASNEIARNINRVADLASSTEHAISQSDRTVQELRDLANALHHTVSRFRS